jgi:hypothetical protein
MLFQFLADTHYWIQSIHKHTHARIPWLTVLLSAPAVASAVDVWFPPSSPGLLGFEAASAFSCNRRALPSMPRICFSSFPFAKASCDGFCSKQQKQTQNSRCSVSFLFSKLVGRTSYGHGSPQLMVLSPFCQYLLRSNHPVCLSGKLALVGRPSLYLSTPDFRHKLHISVFTWYFTIVKRVT